MSDLLHIFRAVNVPLSMAAALAIGIRINDLWEQLSLGRRITWIGAAAYIGNGAVGSILKLHNHAKVDASVAITTGVCVVILAGVWISRKDGPPPT